MCKLGDWWSLLVFTRLSVKDGFFYNLECKWIGCLPRGGLGWEGKHSKALRGEGQGRKQACVLLSSVAMCIYGCGGQPVAARKKQGFHVKSAEEAIDKSDVANCICLFLWSTYIFDQAFVFISWLLLSSVNCTQVLTPAYQRLYINKRRSDGLVIPEG